MRTPSMSQDKTDNFIFEAIFLTTDKDIILIITLELNVISFKIISLHFRIKL